MSAKPAVSGRNSRNIVGARVCKARASHRDCLTQDQLAGRLAVLGLPLDRGTIAKIEVGLRCVYDYEIPVLAQALGVDVRWLLGVSPAAGQRINRPK